MKMETVKCVLESMPPEFDSHQFIEHFICENEREYVEMLYAQKDSQAIFRDVHAMIARYLSENADALAVMKAGRTQSENIKGYESENQNWRRL